jgi:hypothetical protein
MLLVHSVHCEAGSSPRVVMFHVSSILSISKRKEIQFVQKKTKERKRELEKDLKPINLLFNLT